MERGLIWSYKTVVLRLTRKTDYALLALARLAELQGGDEAPCSARQLAVDVGLPEPILKSVLKQLHGAGLLDSKRGAGGGYRLARAPGRLRVIEVIEATEGPVRITLCCGEEGHDDNCDLEGHCRIGGGIRRLNDQIHTFLDGLTLQDLITPPARLVQLGA